MGGVPGVGPAKVLVIGGGVVGTHAARIAGGHGGRCYRVGLARCRGCAIWMTAFPGCLGQANLLLVFWQNI